MMAPALEAGACRLLWRPLRLRLPVRNGLRPLRWYAASMAQALSPQRQPPASSELAAALLACRRAFIAIALFSGMSNILMLSGALFMLEIYDRVLPSRSVPTLVALLLLVTGLYAAQGTLDTLRSRILVRVGNSLDEAMSMRVYDAIVRLPLKMGARGDGAQPIRD